MTELTDNEKKLIKLLGETRDPSKLERFLANMGSWLILFGVAYGIHEVFHWTR